MDYRRTPTDIEARALKWLTKKRIEFIFQYAIAGGANVRGGILVDIVAMIPFPQPIEIYGEHWHKNDLSAEERLRLARVEEEFQREVIIIWGVELVDEETTDRTMEDKLGRQL